MHSKIVSDIPFMQIMYKLTPPSTPALEKFIKILVLCMEIYSKYKIQMILTHLCMHIHKIKM